MSVTSASNSISSNLSNISSDITPQLFVSAKGSSALVPSEDTTCNLVPSLLTDKLVDTFVTLLVLAATAEASV